MELRLATENDSEKISALIRESTLQNPNNYSVDQKNAWIEYNSVERIKSFLKDRKTLCFYIDDKLVGTISLKIDEILGFYVSHELRGKGFGSLLLKKVEQLARESGLTRIHLSATPSAIGFYKRHGYVGMGEIIVTILGVDFEEIAMEKALY